MRDDGPSSVSTRARPRPVRTTARSPVRDLTDPLRLQDERHAGCEVRLADDQLPLAPDLDDDALLRHTMEPTVNQGRPRCRPAEDASMLHLHPSEEDAMNIAVTSDLERRHIPYELLPHPATTTAVAEARVLELEPNEVAKTLILGTPRGYVRALVPASKRIDAHKARVALSLDEVWLVPESELVGAYPEFELGAVPPIAGPGRDRVLIDQSFRNQPWLVFEAGRHDESVRVRTGDLLAATHAIVADICLD